MDYHKADKKLYDIGKQVKIVSALNPVNLKGEKKKVFENNDYNPQFEYKSLSFNPEGLKNELNSLEFDSSVFGSILMDKRDELIQDIEICESMRDEGFTQKSIERYRKPDKEIVELAKKDLSDMSFDEELIEFNAREVQEKFRERLNQYEISWEVKLVDSMASDVMVGAEVIFIRKDLKISKQRLTSMLKHEINCHVLRTENGKLQTFRMFTTGFPNYLETEEGLAIYLVNQLGLNIRRVFFPQIRVILVDMALNKSFSEIFKEALKYRFSKEDAWNLCLRIKRGLKDTSKPGAFTRDALYYSGYLRVKEFLKSNPIKDLYYGKVPIELLDEIKKMRGLKEPKWLPRN